jgi:DNA polymerase-1
MIHINELPFCWTNVVGIDLETAYQVPTKVNKKKVPIDRLGSVIRVVSVSDGTDVWILTQDFEPIKSLLEDQSVLKIFHNALFDLVVYCYQYPCEPTNIYDTLISERILYCGLDYDNELQAVISRRFGEYIDKSLQLSFDKTSPITKEQIEYCAKDVIYLPQIKTQQDKESKERGLEKTIKLDNGVIPAFVDMTITGVGLDTVKLGEIRKEVQTYINNIKTQMYVCLGEDFHLDTQKGMPLPGFSSLCEINFNSPDQLTKVLQKLGIEVNTTKKSVLSYYTGRHPIIKLLLEYKEWIQLNKIRWENFVNPCTNRIHPEWNILGADTGRTSAKNPPMQGVPRPTPDSPNFRQLFKALPGYLILTADYSQQEPRILAHISGDPKLIQAANESDVYLVLGKDIYNRVLTKKDEERQIIKTGVLAIFYGGKPKNLATKLGISLKKAEELESSIQQIYPIAYRWGNQQGNKLFQSSYCSTMIGRKRYYDLKNISKARRFVLSQEARNSPVQGTGADMTKLAMVKIHGIIVDRKLDAHLMLCAHDELVLSVNPDCAQEVKEMVEDEMIKAGEFICPSVKFLVESNLSDSWGH